MAIVEKLAQGDLTKFDAIYKQNWIGALNLLSFWKEKETFENNIKRQQQKKQNN